MPTVTIGYLSFRFEDQRILIASNQDYVLVQDVLNFARQAEDSIIGISYQNPIVKDSGKDTLGIDPSTGLQIVTGLNVQLLDDWKFISLKTSGRVALLGGNITRSDGDIYIDVPGVSYIGNFAIATSTVLISSSGVPSLSPADIAAVANAVTSSVWAASLTSLTSGIGRMLLRLGKKFGLTSVDVVAKTDEYMRTSDNDVSHTITVNPDGSKTLSGSP